MSNDVSGYQGKTFTIEYSVTGQLDGVTFAPARSRPNTGGYNGVQIYQENVESLGLINLDWQVEEKGLRGSKGHRYLVQVLIVGPNPGGANASVELVDATDDSGPPVLLETVGTFVGQTVFYRGAGRFCPQGSILRVNGLDASPGSPIRVRVSSYMLDDAESIAWASLAACVCGQGGGGGGIDNVANIGGAPGEVFAGIAGTTVLLRTLLGVNGVTVSTNADVIEVSGAGLGPLPFTGTVFNANVVANLNETLRYDGSAPGGPFTIYAPPTPAPNQVWAIKEVVGGASASVVVSGNGRNIEDISGVPAPTFSPSTAHVALTYQYDSFSNVWRLI